MYPPISNPQGTPAFKLNGMYGRPQSQQIAPNPMFETSEVLHSKKADKTEIPSPMKSMGITYNPYEVSLGCRQVPDTMKVYMGNTLAQKSYVNAVPTSGMSKLGFTSDRLGVFGMNSKQTPFSQSTY